MTAPSRFRPITISGMMCRIRPLVGLSVLLVCATSCTVSSQSSAPTATVTHPTQAPPPLPTNTPQPNGGSPTPTALAAQAPPSSGTVPLPQIDKLREHAINVAGPATVKIENVGKSLGSGVILRKDGYIVTNNHVVSGETALRVTLANGSALDATLVGTDPLDDLAVVKVNSSSLPVATFGDSAGLVVGQTVLALGNALGFTRTVTDGIISALNRTVSEGPGGGSIPNAVQTSAPINPGNSGGALIDLAGDVVGIPTLTAVDPEFNAPASGIGFAIPSNTVVRITDQLIRSGHVTHTGRAALGILAISVTPDLATQYSLPIQHGVLIAKVLPGSAAAHAGLTSGEVITGVNSTPISSESDLLDTLATHSPGDTIHIKVTTHGGATKTASVKLGERSATATG